MMRLSCTCCLFLVLFLQGCAAPAEKPLPGEYLIVSKGSCLGTCPSFIYQLFSDGRYIFVGRSYTTVHGEQRGSVPAARFAEAMRIIDDLDFRSVGGEGPLECNEIVFDAPGFELTVHTRELDKEFRLGGCAGFEGEDRMFAIKAALEDILAWTSGTIPVLARSGAKHGGAKQKTASARPGSVQGP